jgi:hypothetical protein
LIHLLNQDLTSFDMEAAASYRVAHQLVVAHQAGENELELTMRKELQRRQPALLGYFKSRL